ncbi:hypothetical protein CIB84_016895 [Bambusicola thoracicus]|uniref:Uncharacterized protein n=1 Tax=Bambusicola thoracicus TaxID=9083 RepID=A0A2P4S5I1_BAMTH|nr:hypothetical protein CIB84_016895 [Bambusicola thoracicus]
MNNTTSNGGERTSPHFEASWRDSNTRLVVNSIKAEDNGIYFTQNHRTGGGWGWKGPLEIMESKPPCKTGSILQAGCGTSALDNPQLP